MHQKTTAVNKDDMAYTSASTAENQNESDTAYAMAPIKPAPRIKILWLFEVCQDEEKIFLQNHVMVQNKNMMVSALAIPDEALTISAMWLLSEPANKDAMHPINKKSGLPGA
jgi:hypothetical protein